MELLLLLFLLPWTKVWIYKLDWSDKKNELCPQVLDNALEATVFSDKFERGFGANPSYGFEVVTSQENAQIHKLSQASGESGLKRRVMISAWLIVISRPSRAALRLISLMGCFLASENVRWRKSTGAEKVRVSMSSEPAA